MVTEAHVPNFDSSKPADYARFKSEEVRDNFTSVSRANDLRCKAHVPADLSVYVEPGSYAITSDKTKRFAGGDSPTLSISGGLAGQQKWYVLELDNLGNLIWNSNGSWDYPSPGTPTVPAYNGGRISLCEVIVTWGDTKITQDKIFDARPMINIGVGTANITPGRIYAFATTGQTDFSTTASFIYAPGQNEILVWCDTPTATPGRDTLHYRISGVDYIELNDHTIRFFPAYSFIGGVTPERVIIWKVGVSATPGTFSLNQLSDVSVANSLDGGNRSDALVPRLPGDIPSSANPYETYYSHNLIDHLVDVSSLVPVDTHITTVATGTHKHMASEIEILDPGIFTSAVDVQGALDDVETVIYLPYLMEHKTTGAHGPRVNITQTGNDNALAITKTSTDASSAVAVGVSSGSGPGLYVDNSGTGNCVRIIQNGANRALDIYQNAVGHGIQVTKTNVGAGTCLAIENAGIGAGITLHQIGATVALSITREAGGGGSEHCIQITNNGIGKDIIGNGSNWWIDKNGNARFQSIAYIPFCIPSVYWSGATVNGGIYDVCSTVVSVSAGGSNAFLINASCRVIQASNYRSISAVLYRDGIGLKGMTQAFNINGIGGSAVNKEDCLSWTILDTPGVGAHTYFIRIYGANTVAVNEVNFILTKCWV